jgi:outer membrane protein OmpU
MKKVLFSTTALAAASMLAFSASDAQAGSHSKAKPLSITVGGFANAYVGFSEQKGSYESTSGATNRVGYDSFNSYNDSEIYFQGSTKLDNGVEVSVSVHMEADKVAFGIQQSYVGLKGGFGELNLGSTMKGGVILANNAPRVGLNPHGGDSDHWIVRPASNSIGGSQGTNVGPGTDMGLTYLTPKISGLRLGLSYTPSKTNEDEPPSVGGTSGTQVQVYDAALNYSDKVGTFDVKADIGYKEEHGAALDSHAMWRGGLNVGIGGITIGGSYYDQTDIDSGKGGTSNSDEVEAWDIGISWASGPYKLSATYFHAEKPLASGDQGEDEVDKIYVSGDYAMGPGVNLNGTIMHVEWSDESTADADNNEGWAVVGGVKVSF